MIRLNDGTAPDGTVDQIQADIECLLAGRYGGRPRLAGRTVLSRRLSVVERVAIEPCGTAAPRTAIVKHLPPPFYTAPLATDAPMEFRQEAAVYDFLAALRPPFAERPEVLGRHPHGLLLLEDLGEQDRRPAPPLTDVGPRIGRLLAGFHAATAGQLSGFAAARAALGLEEDQTLGTASVTRARRRFARGLDGLAEWCEVLGLAAKPAVREVLAPVAAAILAPSRYDVLLHDDLCNARQCITHDGRLKLLDFEKANRGHALRDIAKVMIGKFEWDLEAKVMILAWPGFDGDLIAAYRDTLAGSATLTWDDDAWTWDLTAAMVTATVVQVGWLLELTASGHVAGQFLDNLYRVLEPLDRGLPVTDGRSAAQDLLRRLQQRIVIPATR